MKKIITISREFASGGRTIAKLVADELGYKYYDNELIDLCAKESGLSAEFIEKSEQSLSSGWIYNLMLGSSFSATSYTTTGTLPLADQIFNAQRKSILSIAKEEPCVIVGRCADYILKSSNEFDEKEILNVFIYADEQDKINRAVNEYKIPEADAKKVVSQINKRRENHYNTFTENRWGARENYDLLINSAYSGIEATAKLIVDYARL